VEFSNISSILGDLMLVSVNKYWDLDVTAISLIYETEKLQDLLCDIGSSLKYHNGRIFFWQVEGEYVSALRTEPYEDGYLLFGLQTRKVCRHRGYGTQLVLAVCSQIQRDSKKPVYVHIEKKNIASIKLHRNIGFQICAEYGKLIDGTVSHRYYTFTYK